ncbi:hypothetical protein HX004_15535 [Myroides sp. 1354]|uniref:hypothetical protein n=1 Tax=unclassified Myroides TaxID=2642485 RepID=UPI002574CA51|nr:MULTISPECIES: hypothetical protein [unclassified Myroides]MDM1046235.1 hypothetical protein [Myroides sp. R163-1]MDM1057171.1 hypothetical protein [Myroides sp. 1354]MDM1070366.1 hypothetical protein [Myroides sp. 1372]
MEEELRVLQKSFFIREVVNIGKRKSKRSVDSSNTNIKYKANVIKGKEERGKEERGERRGGERSEE